MLYKCSQKIQSAGCDSCCSRFLPACAHACTYTNEHQKQQQKPWVISAIGNTYRPATITFTELRSSQQHGQFLQHFFMCPSICTQEFPIVQKLHNPSKKVCGLISLVRYYARHCHKLQLHLRSLTLNTLLCSGKEIQGRKERQRCWLYLFLSKQSITCHQTNAKRGMKGVASL